MLACVSSVSANHYNKHYILFPTVNKKILSDVHNTFVDPYTNRKASTWAFQVRRNKVSLGLGVRVSFRVYN